LKSKLKILVTCIMRNALRMIAFFGLVAKNANAVAMRLFSKIYVMQTLVTQI